jgi:hypothetical protein
MLRVLPNPLPTSPIKGEVPARVWGAIVPQAQTHTSPLTGRGWSPSRDERFVCLFLGVLT